MFLFDEEGPAHVSQYEEARAKPALRFMTRRTYNNKQKQPDMRLSSSCPSKPLVGSLPIPTKLHDDMPPLTLPGTPPIHGDGPKIISSLFTGRRVTVNGRKIIRRLSSSC